MNRIFCNPFGKTNRKEEEMPEEKNIGIASPWVTFARKVHCMFDTDPEVKVVWDDDLCTLKLLVESAEKAEALMAILPEKKVFGNVEITIIVVPANLEAEPTKMQLFETAFKGNPAVSYMQTVGAFGNTTEIGFVVFQPEVVQFYNDNLGDIDGKMSTLYEDIARDVFEDTENVYFCTDVENQALLGRPLGEWP